MTADKMKTWGGYALTGLAILFLLMDGGMKLFSVPVSVEITAQLGFTREIVPMLGAILLIATALYAWPRTALLGAVLITGYLGGAISIQLQHQAPLFSHVLFRVYIGLMVWGGLYLRSPVIRQLFPIRTSISEGP